MKKETRSGLVRSALDSWLDAGKAQIRKGGGPVTIQFEQGYRAAIQAVYDISESLLLEDFEILKEGLQRYIEKYQD